MGYSLHIERERDEFGDPDPPITLAEWKQAIETIPALRLATGPVVLRNPKTGNELTIDTGGARAEACLDGTSWVGVFFWYPSERVSFRAPSGPRRDQVMQLARTLARALGAWIVGDEGEVYE